MSFVMPVFVWCLWAMVVMFGYKPAVYDYSMCVMLLSGNQQCGQIKCLLLRINYPYSTCILFLVNLQSCAEYQGGICMVLNKTPHTPLCELFSFQFVSSCTLNPSLSLVSEHDSQHFDASFLNRISLRIKLHMDQNINIYTRHN